MPHANPQLVRLFSDALARCRVTPDEAILILTQSGTRAEYVDAMLSAVGAMGGNAEVLQLPGIGSDVFDYGGRPEHMLELDRYVEDKPYILEFLTGADFIVDLSADRLVHTRFRWEVMNSESRMLSIHEPPEVLERMVPTDALADRLDAGRAILEGGEEMHVTSAAGTDLTTDLTNEKLVIGSYGFTRGPGDWDGYPGGFTAVYTTDDSHDGRIVMAPGDVILPMGRYVERPVTFEIEDGRLVHIEGDGADAALITDYLAKFDREEVYRMSHVGFGLNDRAEWDAMAFSREPLTGMDNRTFAGSFMWSSGPNAPIMDRTVRAHFDFPMRGCSVFVDGQPIIEAGELVAPDFALD